MAVLRKYNPATEQWEILQGGVQGLQGPPVALAKGTVTTTAAGTNADFSITGTPPNQKLNLTLPRGEAGGWITTQIDAGTQDLNLLTTPGSYKDNNVAGAISRGYPEDGWQGIHEVVGIWGHTIQRTTRISSKGTPEDSRGYMRVLQGGTWSPWRRIPLVGQIYLDIVGAGRPDVAGTMSTEVAALVAAATSGAKFRSTNGPQGAWEWQKRGTTWVCVEGDTGDMPLVTWDATGAITYGTLPSGLAPSGAYPGGVWARRTSSAVHLILRCAQVTTDWSIPGTGELNLSDGLRVSVAPGTAAASAYSLALQIRTNSVVGIRRDYSNQATTYGAGGNNIVTVATFPPPNLSWPIVTTI